MNYHVLYKLWTHRRYVPFGFYRCTCFKHMCIIINRFGFSLKWLWICEPAHWGHCGKTFQTFILKPFNRVKTALIDRVKLGKLGQVFKKTHVGQSWKKAKIHKNIANVASGLGKILEKKRLKKIFWGGRGGSCRKKNLSPNLPNEIG